MLQRPGHRCCDSRPTLRRAAVVGAARGCFSERRMTLLRAAAGVAASTPARDAIPHHRSCKGWEKELQISTADAASRGGGAAIGKRRFFHLWVAVLPAMAGGAAIGGGGATMGVRRCYKEQVAVLLAGVDMLPAVLSAEEDGIQRHRLPGIGVAVGVHPDGGGSSRGRGRKRGRPSSSSRHIKYRGALITALLGIACQPWRLLSVACVSAAAKMEEYAVPPLSELDAGGGYEFCSDSVRPTELLLLSTLG
ncbi:hypothetical protein ACQ4PT_012498 [Festuca glaucescens]